MYNLKNKILENYPIYFGKCIVVLKTNSSIIAINIEDFEELWSYKIKNLVTETLKIDDENIIIFNNRNSLFAHTHEGVYRVVEGRYYVYCQNYSIFIDIQNPKIIQNSINPYTIPAISTNILYFQNAIFQISSNILICHTLATGSELWRVDVSEIGAYTDLDKVKKGIIDYEVLVYGDLIIFSSGPHIFACRQQNGQIAWQTTLRYNQAMKVLYNDKLFVKSGLFYYSLEASTGKVITEFDFQKGWPAELGVGRWMSWHNVYDDCLIVTDSLAKKILFLDKEIFMIKHLVEIEGSKNEIPIANAPQLHGNRLYQLDGDNTLHIFEKNG